MKIRKYITILFVGIILLGIIFFASPYYVQAQHEVMGCCQFEGDEAGCWYPADPGPCANLEGKFFEDAKCNAEVTKCIDNKEDDSGSSEPQE